MLPPLLVDLVLPQLPGLLLHALLLLARLLLQVEVFESDILVIHEFPLLPLAEAVLVILSLVSPQVVLDCPHLLQGELVKSELEVYQVLVDTCCFEPLGPASLVHLAVSEVQRQQRPIHLHALDEEEQFGYRGLLSLGIEWRVLVLVYVVALEIEDLERGVLLEGVAEGLDGLGPQLVALELQLPQNTVLDQHLGQLNALRVLYTLPRQLQHRQGSVESDIGGEDTAASRSEVKPRECVLLGCVIALQVLKHDQHAALQAVHLLLLFLALLSKLQSIVLISELLFFLFSLLLLPLLLSQLLLLLDLYYIYG